uniref:NADH dehydrogenase [ubiquinone] 1 beta subcomplex subunit 11, mitochondrial n=1 Tax=Ditylenchus dipsaci TaxID=166011 RepID=A0A915ELK5_9BILA
MIFAGNSMLKASKLVFNDKMLRCNAYRRLPYLCQRLASSKEGGGDHGGKDSHSRNDGHHAEDDVKMEMQSEMYKPGSDHFAYENPWPKLNKGRLDWMFQDSWRRPLAPDQGAKMRKEWIYMGQCTYNEYYDWLKYHRLAIMFFTMLCPVVLFKFMFLEPDWPAGHSWATREAHLEIARRQKAGLPLIGKDLIDPSRVMQDLPSEEELRDFEIII